MADRDACGSGTLAATRDSFTADDVWNELSEHERPHEPRALGAVLKAMAHERSIVATAEYRPSEREKWHARPIRFGGEQRE